MPLSDKERLERVYQRAASIRLTRRLKLLAAALPVVVLAGAVVVAASTSSDDGKRLQVAAGSSSTVPEVTMPDEASTTLTIPVAPPTSGTVLTTRPTTRPTIPPTTETTLGKTIPDQDNCGGYYPGDTQPPKPPEGMRVWVEASKPVVRRGEEVVFTLHAKWSGAEPLTRSRGGRQNLIYATLNGSIAYSSGYDPAVSQAGGAEETFQPGEEKTMSVRWDTSQGCGYGGMREAYVRGGSYTVYGNWEDQGAGYFAEPAHFDLVD